MNRQKRTPALPDCPESHIPRERAPSPFLLSWDPDLLYPGHLLTLRKAIPSLDAAGESDFVPGLTCSVVK